MKWLLPLSASAVLSLLAFSCQNLDLPVRAQGDPAPAAPDTGKNLFGINLNYATTDDWSEDRLFADAMKQARVWNKGSTFENPAVPAALDAHFWPTEDACLCVMDLRRNEGTYRCSFEGTATVKPGPWGLGGPGSIQNVVYHPDTGRTTFEIVLTQGVSAMTLAFTDTKGGIRDLRIMRPKARGSAESYPEGTLFTDQILALVSKFRVIRFMDYFRTNSSPLAHWSDRPLPTDASFNSGYRTSLGAPLGGCYEYAVALCNQTHADLWLNIPLHADDDFVTRLATLVRDGADGHPGLDPGLNVYVEYSNEVWNTAPGFSQGNENHDLARAEEAAGKLPSLKAADTSDNTWYWAWRRVGRRLVEVSDLFRAVWGDDAMPAPGKAAPRVRPVLEGQQGNYPGFEGPILTFLDQNYPHPPNWYLYGAGGSGYYNPDDSDGLTLDALWTSGIMDSAYWRDTWAKGEVTLAKAFGLRRIAYEGGPSFDKGSKNDALRAAAWGDPRMEQNLVDHVDRGWNGTDGDLFVFYASAGGYQWGFTQDLFNLDTPKFRAIDRLNARNRAPVTVGQVPPFTVQGVDFDNSLNYHGYPYKAGTSYVVRDRHYVVYAFRTVKAGPVSLTLNLGSSLGQVQVSCDGLPRVTLPAGDHQKVPPAPVVLTGLKPGLHSVLIRTGAADLTIHSLTFAP